jgi:hypothetical protein
VHVSGLNPDDYYASVGSLDAFGQVDPTTGAFTPLVSVNGPHGVVFIPDGQDNGHFDPFSGLQHALLSLHADDLLGLNFG